MTHLSLHPVTSYLFTVGKIKQTEKHPHTFKFSALDK